MTLNDIQEILPKKLMGFGHTLKLDLDADGVVVVDATQSPPVLLDGDKDAEVTLTTSLETFERILNGTQDPNLAFMMGKLKISGSMGLALKLAAMLED